AGIRLVSQKSLARYPHLALFLEHLTGSTKQSVCVVSFHGTFSSDQVQMPVGRPRTRRTGKVAIVIVTTPQNKLLGTVILERDPLPLRHLVLGPPRAGSGAGAPPRPLT
ncbi:MAG TPA: hypothetical protein VE991_05480, partial [Acidimicrobiales bacterium]|nr:hypothetical protein [Acidimicrobiales bacterium]